ncbi:MAG: type II toxin-antitoxin system MqsA family antitoxin [Bacteroidetes bacterium]|nr:type II toxin-antitoxin system MqsA family antitoxin [Bacteroidota bacterium]
MTCFICKSGSYIPGKVTVKLERDSAIVLIKEVPAEVCDTCANYLLSQQTSKTVLAIAKQRFDSGTELEVIKLLAA